MKTLFTILLIIGLFSSYSVVAKEDKQQLNNSIEVIQFHSNSRCMSCKKIEELTKVTLKKHFPNLSLKLLNVEEKSNERTVIEFGYWGTALFLYSPVTKEKLDLTGFAYQKVRKPEQFELELKTYIANFQNK